MKDVSIWNILIGLGGLVSGLIIWFFKDLISRRSDSMDKHHTNHYANHKETSKEIQQIQIRVGKVEANMESNTRALEHLDSKMSSLFVELKDLIKELGRDYDAKLKEHDKNVANIRQETIGDVEVIFEKIIKRLIEDDKKS